VPEYTQTQKAILKVLEDGYAHKRKELMDVLSDDLSSLSCLATMLTRMRKKMRPVGQDIVCELQSRQICYRWVRLLGGE